MAVAVHLTCFQNIALCASLFFCILKYGQAYSLAGQQLQDLVTNDEASFLQEVSGWTLSRYEDRINFAKYSDCSGKLLLGGFGILGSTYLGQNGQYFERVYDGLPYHQSLRFSFSLWMLDEWGPTDYVQLIITNNYWSYYGTEYETILSYTTPLNITHKSNVCGGSANDLPEYKIYGKVSRSFTKIKLTLKTNIDQLSTTKSFGIRDINLLFVKDPDTAVVCPNLQATNFQCACPTGSFYYFKDCQPCASSCEICFDGLPTQCYLCKTGYYFDGYTCNRKCNSSCTACYGPSPNQCLKCGTGYVIFKGACRLPCASTTDYLYNNDSCYRDCLSPRTIEAVGTAKFCLEASQYNIPLPGINMPANIEIEGTSSNRIDENSESYIWIIIGVSVGVGVLVVVVGVYFFVRRRKLLKKQVKPSQIDPSQDFSDARLNNIPSFARDIIERPPCISQMVEGFEENQYLDSPISGERDQVRNQIKLNNIAPAGNGPERS